MASAPQITRSVVDRYLLTKSLTGNEYILVKGYSVAEATMIVYSPIGAAISLDTMIIRNGNDKAYGYQATFSSITDNVFTFSAEDEFGNIGTATYIAPMVNYEAPTCVLSNERPDGSGNMTVSCSGTWFNDTFGNASSRHNELTVSYRYVEWGQDINNATWTAMTVYTSGNAYSASAYLSGLDYQKAYFFEVVARDLLSQGRDTSQGVTGAPVFHWSKNDVTFEKSALFNDTANFYGGTTGISYTDLTNRPNIPDVKYGDWLPEIDPAGVNYYETQRGWYMKIGNVVTVGFYIKAMCTIYDAHKIEWIVGLPSHIAPVQASAGGGMCSGAKLSANKNFQCWVAETLGYITPRVQDCNNANAQNISTSASGVYFPINGGQITLSGTITYLTY